jgi:hypothetical protein
MGTAQLLVQTPLQQGYVAPMLNSSLQKLDGSHHDMADRHEISIYQMAMNLFL